MKNTVRMKKNFTFRYVFKKGRYCVGRYITIHILKSKNSSINFFGVCVSKKNGNSVNRNRLKRWVRNIYTQEEVLLKKGFNIIVLYKKQTTTVCTDFLKIREDICKCFKDLEIYE